MVIMMEICTVITSKPNRRQTIFPIKADHIISTRWGATSALAERCLHWESKIHITYMFLYNTLVWRSCNLEWSTDRITDDLYVLYDRIDSLIWKATIIDQKEKSTLCCNMARHNKYVISLMRLCSISRICRRRYSCLLSCNHIWQADATIWNTEIQALGRHIMNIDVMSCETNGIHCPGVSESCWEFIPCSYCLIYPENAR